MHSREVASRLVQGETDKQTLIEILYTIGVHVLHEVNQQWTQTNNDGQTTSHCSAQE